MQFFHCQFLLRKTGMCANVSFAPIHIRLSLSVASPGHNKVKKLCSWKIESREQKMLLFAYCCRTAQKKVCNDHRSVAWRRRGGPKFPSSAPILSARSAPLPGHLTVLQSKLSAALAKENGTPGGPLKSEIKNCSFARWQGQWAASLCLSSSGSKTARKNASQRLQ